MKASCFLSAHTLEEATKKPLLVSKKRQNASSYLPDQICRIWHRSSCQHFCQSASGDMLIAGR
jgi:hypothetical protein